jgi:hypothetical protein
MTALTRLQVAGASITAEGAAALRSGMPDTNVIFEESHRRPIPARALETLARVVAVLSGSLSLLRIACGSFRLVSVFPSTAIGMLAPVMRLPDTTVENRARQT